MPISTNIAIQNGYYGRLEYNSKKKQYDFIPLAKAVTLEEVSVNIEDDTVSLVLSWVYQGRRRYKRIDRSQFMDPNMIEELAHRGADVSKELFNAFVTSIRLQEELFEANKVLPTAVFSGLGWIDVPDFSNTGQVTGFTRCYRLNELGKYLGKDATRLVFDFSEGSDKKRMNYKISERYSTVIISTGEASLLDKCKSKLEGLRIRVMELRKPLTDSAEHSNKIKATCLEHCGHAAPMVAKYIMDQGGTDYVLGLYNEWKTKLIEILPQSYNMERFVEKFAALFMASADICSDALGIEFDKKGLQQLLIEYDAETSDSRSSSAESYDILLEECRINLHRFHVGYDKSLPTKIPHAEQVSIAHADC